MTEIQTKMPYLPLKKQMMYGLSYKIALLFFTIFVSVQGYAQADKKAEARSFLMQHAAKWGLNAEQAQQVRVSDAYTSKGITHYYFQQTYQDLPVYNALMNVVVLPKGESKMTANRFVKNLPKESSAGIPTFSPQNAIEKAANHLNLRYLKKANLKAIDKDALAKGAFMSKYLFDKGDISTEDITVELLWVSDAENQVHLAWNILIYETTLANIWQVRVDAISGEVIEKNNYVAHCDWGNHTDEATHLALHHEVDKVDGEFSTLATGDYNVFDMPLEAPSFGSRTIVNAPWTRAGAANPIAALQWHNDGTTTYNITRGNNVWAKEDIANDNETTIGASPTSPTFDYNFPFQWRSDCAAQQSRCSDYELVFFGTIPYMMFCINMDLMRFRAISKMTIKEEAAQVQTMYMQMLLMEAAQIMPILEHLPMVKTLVCRCLSGIMAQVLSLLRLLQQAILPPQVLVHRRLT